ncbi:AAA family ATPase [Aminobacter niigataensis]|uniref:AAA family ATPase n=1 Tax=Aminobacter niigataensis TaxID=83265 RepID=UPI0024C54B10|nr:AAA family ATPase [Aminobacter niigataensis]CAI2934348.1 Chromosome segregation/condensation domain-containing protein [Aminobacter niigataensis]
MKFNLVSLKLSLRRADEQINFSKLSYFWGQMGAGKSSIARLVDYCLGGTIQLSPALQAEFVSATLTLELERATVSIERARDAADVFASWEDDQGRYSVVIPARVAAGEVIPETGVETLSDLVFWLSEINPPRVRKSKAKADSKIVRLSLRDLLWYCYLDQDHIDSSFFYLEESAEFYMRLKSRDVIRYVIGYHDERVADLEAELDQLRANRTARVASIDSLSKALAEVGIESEAQVAERESKLRASINKVNAELEVLRKGRREEQTTHAIDELAKVARSLGSNIAKLDLNAEELRTMRDRHVRHRNEIDMLGLKFRRSAEAREILGDVAFSACPRCTQSLPTRPAQCCDVCGQEDLVDLGDPAEVAALEADIASRRAELKEAIAAIDSNLARMRAERSGLLQTKDKAEADINRATAEQDSAFLSMSVLKEREGAALEAELASIAWLLRLPLLLQQQREALAHIVALEQAKREALKEARTNAEADRTSLERFAGYFLDCLVLSGVPGIQRNDHVELDPPSFYPAILSADPRDLTRSTFTSLSSGGKKTLFKCCFAIALHRIAAQLHAPLPELLIVDSPMKNISERENKAQFEGFYRMLYQLNAGELRHTQFVLIDKEFFAPPGDLAAGVTNRHMQPDSDEHQPLIRYYRGK